MGLPVALREVTNGADVASRSRIFSRTDSALAMWKHECIEVLNDFLDLYKSKENVISMQISTKRKSICKIIKQLSMMSLYSVGQCKGTNAPDQSQWGRCFDDVCCMSARTSGMLETCAVLEMDEEPRENSYTNSWWRGPAVEHWSLADVLSLSCARLVADG